MLAAVLIWAQSWGGSDYRVAVFFFPLAIVVGVLAARRWKLGRAMVAAAVLFVIAVLVAWQAQGFAPSARDLIWLSVVLTATWASSRYKRPNRRASPAPFDAG